jgi:hypothetical protein
MFRHLVRLAPASDGDASLANRIFRALAPQSRERTRRHIAVEVAKSLVWAVGRQAHQRELNRNKRASIDTNKPTIASIRLIMLRTS